MDEVIKNDGTSIIGKEENRAGAEQSETGREEPEVEATTFTSVTNFKYYIYGKILLYTNV